jgi:hypothetical protein
VFAQVAKSVVWMSKVLVVRSSRFAESTMNKYFEFRLACEISVQLLVGKSNISIVYCSVQPAVLPLTVEIGTLTAAVVPVAEIS